VRSLVHRLGCDDPQVRALDPKTIEDRRRANQGDQAASQNDRPLSGIAKSPNAWAYLIDAVAAVDFQGQAQLLAQPILIEHDRCQILWLDLDWAAFGALAKPAALAITDDLPTMQVAMWAKYEVLIDGRRLYGRAEQGACSQLVRRQCPAMDVRSLSEQATHQRPSMM